MASQSMGGLCHQPVGQEPWRETPSNSLSESWGYSRKSLMRQGDQVGIQDQAIQESLEPEDQSQHVVSEEDNTNLLSLPFVRKLWTIVQNDAFHSVNWGDDRNSIMIEVDLFQREILHHRGTRKVFAMKRLKSCIRQLYRNGFRKVRPEDSALDSVENRKTMVKYKVVLCLPLFVMRTSSYLHTQVCFKFLVSRRCCSLNGESNRLDIDSG